MKKAWFALAALAGVAVWSAAIEHSTMQRGGLTVEDCAGIRSIFVGRDRANGAFMIEALGLENGCIPPDRHIARRLIKRFLSFENPSLSIVDYVDRLLLAQREDAAARWLPTAVAVHFAWDRLTWTSGTAPAVQSPRLKTEIGEFYNTYKGDDATAIVASLERYLSRPALSSEAELDIVIHLLRRLRLIATRESFYWSGRMDEWHRPATLEDPLLSMRYHFAIFCDDDRAIRRVTDLYLAGRANDNAADNALRGLLRRADKVAEFPELLQKVIAKLGELAEPRLAPAMRRADISSAARDCASAIESEARRASAE